ncbi:OprO/OprP family phosphate-selective porin [Pendulispora rubella]|uniref:OprO/OprP family phosphate-selective porin n=1 Tax=Pendulispora rubella TaxID=2741070 RepID=A0ABZ2L7X4_9BACT
MKIGYPVIAAVVLFSRVAAAESVSGAPASLAGYRNGSFTLRDEKENFVISPSGFFQMDHLSYWGPGIGDTALKPTFAFRRVRLSLAGQFLKRWDFRIEFEMGRTALDNTSGRADEPVAAPPGVQPTPATAQYAPAQTVKTHAQLAVMFLNYKIAPALNIRIGQLPPGFTMEQMTLPQYYPFMEKALATRVMGQQVYYAVDPEINVWGVLGNDLLTYYVAYGNGAGVNRLNTDGRGDISARVYARPFSGRTDLGPMRELQFGGSVIYGSRDPLWTYYDYNPMTTGANYLFWRPTYTNSIVGRTVHVIPAHDQWGLAAELRVPVDRFDFQGEFVYLDNGTREVVEGYQNQDPTAAPGTLGFGRMRGMGYYIFGGVWLFGPRTPSKDHANTDGALQLMLRWEQMNLKYEGYSRTSSTTSTGAPAFTGKGPYDGNIRVNALTYGAHYWATKHIRVSGQWTTYVFPEVAIPTSPLAPRHTLHELMFRGQVYF